MLTCNVEGRKKVEVIEEPYDLSLFLLSVRTMCQYQDVTIDISSSLSKGGTRLRNWRR